MDEPLMIGDVVEDLERHHFIIRHMDADGIVGLSTLDTGLTVQRRIEELTFVSEWDEREIPNGE